jgi:coenzyme F420-0:L-glutamate ligase/coenzyme F420-1:gamma-L-glutamate ligase
LIAAASVRAGLSVQAGDIILVAQKIVSKAAGLLVDLTQVKPSARALEIAARTEKDPALVEVILGESSAVVMQAPGVLITEHVSGAILANAGVDRSNVDPAFGGEPALLLPREPDAAAQTLREGLAAAFGCAVGVIITDSWGRPWRVGTTGAALGVAGVPAVHDYRGRGDLFGRELKISIEAVADELAAAGNILMGQADEASPVVIVSGFVPRGAPGAARELMRPREFDLFR